MNTRKPSDDALPLVVLELYDLEAELEVARVAALHEDGVLAEGALSTTLERIRNRVGAAAESVELALRSFETDTTATAAAVAE
jgi:hypothetical protein